MADLLPVLTMADCRIGSDVPQYTGEESGSMAREYPPMDISHDPELLKLAEEVRKTQKAQTVKLTEGVTAVVKPERIEDRRRPGRRKQPARTSQRPTKAYTLESAYGAVSDAEGS
jgi:hypothetical protein